MGTNKVFLDSNVLVSALLSSKGASFEIIRNTHIQKITSKAVKKEVEEATKRLGINPYPVIYEDIKIISLNLEKDKISKTYSKYVLDIEDSHVVAGAHKAESHFLLTHNIKHYQTIKIRNSLSIIVMKPGIFLQYLRSQ